MKAVLPLICCLIPFQAARSDVTLSVSVKRLDGRIAVKYKSVPGKGVMATEHDDGSSTSTVQIVSGKMVVSRSDKPGELLIFDSAAGNMVWVNHSRREKMPMPLDSAKQMAAAANEQLSKLMEGQLKNKIFPGQPAHSRPELIYTGRTRTLNQKSAFVFEKRVNGLKQEYCLVAPKTAGISDVDFAVLKKYAEVAAAIQSGMPGGPDRFGLEGFEKGVPLQTRQFNEWDQPELESTLTKIVNGKIDPSVATVPADYRSRKPPGL